MKKNLNSSLIATISWGYLFGYFTSDVSLFRLYQNIFLESVGKDFTENIIELGCEKKYYHDKFFPNAKKYSCTNISREYDHYLDITNMKELEDNSQSGYICIS